MVRKLLETAIFAAFRAGKEILRIYETDFAVEKKEDKSPLTLADKNAHKVISEVLSDTKIPALSEEGKEIPFSERKNWKRLWIADPLDGTKEFVKRNGEFTVNIALVENQKPILGVIYAPVTKILYWGIKGVGSFKCKASDVQSAIKHSSKLPMFRTKKFTVVTSRSHLTKETTDFIEEMKKKHGDVEIISAGSSLKFCLIAEGTADIYPRFGTTMEWDTAAGHAIINAVGKKVIDLNTKEELKYNKENLRNNSFLAE